MGFFMWIVPKRWESVEIVASAITQHPWTAISYHMSLILMYTNCWQYIFHIVCQVFVCIEWLFMEVHRQSLCTFVIVSRSGSPGPRNAISVCKYMMTSSNGSTFRVSGTLCGEFTGHPWNIHGTKSSFKTVSWILKCYQSSGYQWLPITFNHWATSFKLRYEI